MVNVLLDTIDPDLSASAVQMVNDPVAGGPIEMLSLRVE